LKNKKIFQEAKKFFVTAGEIRVAIKSLAYWESSLYLTKSLSFMKFKLGLKSWKWFLNLESTKWRNFQIAFILSESEWARRLFLTKKSNNNESLFLSFLGGALGRKMTNSSNNRIS
jgi:hypothetical protein